ncbi:MAG: hypothetical protein CL910_10035 [Deltaproteobacteria bacterium]|nr:hypothetical protein [Deltaproteobacteria bacterium]
MARNPRLLAAIRLLFWTHLISAIMVPFFREWGGISLRQVLFLNGWFMLWNFLLEVPTGTVADRFSRKTSILLGLALGTGAIGVMVSAPRFEVFLLAEVIAALAYTLLSGADEALLYDSLLALGREEEAQRSFSRLESFKLAGIVVGAVAGALLATPLGLRMTVALQMLPMGASVLLALLLIEPSVHGAAQVRPGYGEIFRGGVRHFLRTPALGALALDLVTINAACWLILWLYQPLLEAAGIGIAWFGLVHVGLSLGQIAVLGQSGRLQRWLGSRARLLQLAAWLPGLAFLGLGVAGSPWSVIPLVILAASFGLARSTLFAASLHSHIPSERRATVVSTISMLRTLGIAVGNTLGGLAVAFSLHGTAFATGVVILLLALLARSREEHLSD